MKILLVAHKYPPHSVGGVEVYTRHLAHALSERHQVLVFYRHDQPGGPPLAEVDEQLDGVGTRRVSLARRGLGASVAGEFLGTFLNPALEEVFARLLATWRPDVVHFQHVMALSARLPALAARAGVPALLTLHDYWFICGNSQLIWPDAQTCRGKALGMNCVRCAAAARFPSPLARVARPALAPLFLVRDRIVRRAAMQVHRLISPSHFLMQQYVAAGFPAERFVVLENGLPLERIRRAAWRAAEGPLRVTYLGSLAWQKGVHVLIEAMNGLPPGSARLRICGDPAVFPVHAARLRQAAQHPGIEFLGRVANEQVGQVLADSDVVVVPSLWYENSPIVIQEARAAGVPVVASGHGALTEKVRHEIDGLLFPVGDAAALRRALLRLRDEPGLLERLRKNVPPAVDLVQHVQELEELYRVEGQGRA
jgi:glycosyltransferase involved in cell wall biosynthesis